MQILGKKVALVPKIATHGAKTVKRSLVLHMLTLLAHQGPSRLDTKLSGFATNGYACMPDHLTHLSRHFVEIVEGLPLKLIACFLWNHTKIYSSKEGHLSHLIYFLNT